MTAWIGRALSNDLTTCWADTEFGRRCHNRVPRNPDHIGLCDGHLDQMRDPHYVNEPERKPRLDGPNSPQGYAWAQDFRRIAS